MIHYAHAGTRSDPEPCGILAKLQMGYYNPCGGAGSYVFWHEAVFDKDIEAGTPVFFP